MVEHEGATVVRIENPRVGPRQVLAFGSGLLLLFVLTVIIGAVGPDVFSDFTTDIDQEVSFSGTKDKSFYTIAFQMQPTNQLFWVRSRFSAPLLNGGTDVAASFDVTIALTGIVGTDGYILHDDIIERTVTCAAGADWCDWINLWGHRFLQDGVYRLEAVVARPDSWQLTDGTSTPGASTTAQMAMESRVSFVTQDYTLFEMGWRYFFLAVTLSAMWEPGQGFVPRLLRLGRRHWSFQQHWTLALLLGLVFFNQPFFAGAIYSDHHAAGFAAFGIVSSVSFCCMLLLWLLCIFADVAAAALQSSSGSIRSSRGRCCAGCLAGSGGSRGGRGVAKYWIPKVALTGAVFAVALAGYSYYRYKREADPQYDLVDDDRHTLTVFTGVLAGLTALALAWLLALGLAGGVHLRQLSPAYQFLFCSTVLLITVAASYMFAAAFRPWDSTRITFLGLYTLCNLYVWTLAYAYAPVRAGQAFEVSSDGDDAGDGSGGMSGVGPAHFALKDVDVGIDDGGEEEAWDLGLQASQQQHDRGAAVPTAL